MVSTSVSPKVIKSIKEVISPAKKLSRPKCKATGTRISASLSLELCGAGGGILADSPSDVSHVFQFHKTWEGEVRGQKARKGPGYRFLPLLSVSGKPKGKWLIQLFPSMVN